MPSDAPLIDAALADELTTARRRALWVLSTGQVLSGISFGATVSLGAVLAAAVSGDDSLSGLATAAITLGHGDHLDAAGRPGRTPARPASGVGHRDGGRAGRGSAWSSPRCPSWSFALLLIGFALIGAGQAANLQARFAATDLATDVSRGRDLSLVVWATTLGAVLGPNLVGPGEVLGGWVGMPPMTGPYLFTVLGQAAGIVLYLAALRPDPLLLAQRALDAADRGGVRHRPGGPAGRRRATRCSPWSARTP